MDGITILFLLFLVFCFFGGWIGGAINGED